MTDKFEITNNIIKEQIQKELPGVSLEVHTSYSPVFKKVTASVMAKEGSINYFLVFSSNVMDDEENYDRALKAVEVQSLTFASGYKTHKEAMQSPKKEWQGHFGLVK